MMYRSPSNEIYFIPDGSTEYAMSLRVGYIFSDGMFNPYLDKRRDFSKSLSEKERIGFVRFDPNELNHGSKILVLKFAFGDYTPWRSSK